MNRKNTNRILSEKRWDFLQRFIAKEAVRTRKDAFPDLAQRATVLCNITNFVQGTVNGVRARANIQNSKILKIN